MTWGSVLGALQWQKQSSARNSQNGDGVKRGKIGFLFYNFLELTVNWAGDQPTRWDDQEGRRLT